MISRFKCSFKSKSEDCKQFLESQKAGKDGTLVAVQNAAPKKLAAQRRSRRTLLLSPPK
jgi:hypothetical protein